VATQPNVIELVVKFKDQVTSGITQLGQKLKGFSGLAVLGGIAGVGLALNKVVAASREAEDALVRFDLAFKNIGVSSRKTREDILRFADSVGESSIFDDESILKAQTALLKFQSVSGQTFDRARAVAVDFASAMGGDVVNAAELVGRAIERPELAIRQLRSAGVVFSRDQEKMIKSLVETGDRAKAAGIILGELERRFKGAADVAAGTLSGSISRLGNAFDNLFEIDAGPLTTAINSLADALNDPRVREGVQLILSGLTQMLALAVKLAAKTGEFASNILSASANFQARNSGGEFSLDFDSAPITATTELTKELKKQLEKISDLKDDASSIDGNRSAIFAQLKKNVLDQIAAEEQYATTLRQRIALSKQLDATRKDAADFNKQLDAAADAFITDLLANSAAAGKEVAALSDELKKAGAALAAQLDPQIAFNQSVEEAEALYKAGAISLGTYSKALDAAQEALYKARASTDISTVDAAIEEGMEKRRKAFDDAIAKENELNEARKRNLAEQTKAIDAFVNTFADAMERMLDNGRFSFRELGAYLLRELAGGLLRKALDLLKKMVKDALSPQTGSGGNGGGVIGAIVQGIGSIFGYASGGNFSSGQRVRLAEEGPEMVGTAQQMRVYNLRQLSGMGLGKASYRGGDVHVTVHGDVDRGKFEALAEMIEVRMARQERMQLRTFERNGLEEPL
jgi:hypothetical protein